MGKDGGNLKTSYVKIYRRLRKMMYKRSTISKKVLANKKERILQVL